MRHYIIFFVKCSLLRHLTPFDWKFLQIGTHRAKDLRKNVSKLQNGELTPVPLTLLVIRVVLLLWSYGSHKGFWAQLYIHLLTMNNLAVRTIKTWFTKFVDLGLIMIFKSVKSWFKNVFRTTAEFWNKLYFLTNFFTTYANFFQPKLGLIHICSGISPCFS